MKAIVPRLLVNVLSAALVLATVLGGGFVLARDDGRWISELPGASSASLPAWVEPRSLNITDLVGQIPDELLQGMIISFRGGEGLVLFESSADLGNTLVITATIHARWMDSSGTIVTVLGCLGQFPAYDSPGSASPPSVLRLYDESGQELLPTTSTYFDYYYTPATLMQPLANSKTFGRYPLVKGNLQDDLEPDGLHLPANMGCRIRIRGDRPVLTAVFTVQKPIRPQIVFLGSQEEAFHSYIGPGDVGHFQPLMNQMTARYSLRHERFALSIPEGANYLLVINPPMPGQACYYNPPNDYCTPNEQRPSGGTMRLEGSALSVDLLHGGSFFLGLAWKDADLSGNSEFLPIISPLTRITAPEYVLPPGIGWNACYTAGNCSNSVLQAIHDATAILRLVYLRVSMPYGNIDVLPVKVAGPGWSPAGASQTAAYHLISDGVSLPFTLSQAFTRTVYLPIIHRYPPLTGCPCGIFNEHGQMIWLSP